jgi:predicted small lipoprotein YifL
MKAMYRYLSMMILFLTVVGLAACGQDARAVAPPTDGAAQTTPTAVSHSEATVGFSSLVDGLRGAGAQVELTGELLQPFFAVAAKAVSVNDADVQVFEYDSVSAAQQEANLVSPDGGSVGTSAMLWMATPHFYQAGRLIVLYVGDDASTINLLTSVLGPPFAGGDTAVNLPSTDSCPAATADTRLLTNEAEGYCLLYPTEYKVERPNANEIDLVIGSLLNVQDPRVSIVVEAADGRSAEQMADGFLAAVDGFDVTRTSTAVAGVEAIVLDNLPGQELNRRVWFVHNGRSFQMMFTPADQSLGEPYTQMEALYELITDSFTAFAPLDDVKPGSDCLEPNADEQPLTYQAYNFCMLHPTGYDVDEGVENQVALYVGSLMDVEHPKAFINVWDAAGRTAEEAADQKVSEIETAMPGYAVERTFGLSVGYEPAWVLENVPGQDVSRQVFVVHAGQLYTFTFVPADPSAGDVYAQMEALFTTVVNSFRFLK